MQKSNFFHSLPMALVFVSCFLFLCSGDFSVANEHKFVYDSKEKRDPFVSLVGKNVKLTDVELLDSIADVKVEGVIVDPHMTSSAIVNGQILKVGDFMGGFKLEKVTNYYIIMTRDGEEHKIQFRSLEEDRQ
jgi:hypothetical protein